MMDRCIALAPQRTQRTARESFASRTSSVGPQLGHAARASATSRTHTSDQALRVLRSTVGSGFRSQSFVTRMSLGQIAVRSERDVHFVLAKAGISLCNRLCSTVERRPGVLTDEYRCKILRILEETPDISQRELARELGISLGKANYCLRALVQKGLVKANNFKNSNNKKAYLYLLTRKGIAEKARATVRFLEHKMAEYEALRREIEELRREVRR
jgi:EPS-associated MarR family transcriptional regulator